MTRLARFLASPPVTSLAGVDRATLERHLADLATDPRAVRAPTVACTNRSDQQDWGAALSFDGAALWSAWAPDLWHVASRFPGIFRDVFTTTPRRSPARLDASRVIEPGP